MKFTFKPSPNYRDTLSTGRIMMELTAGLLVVFAFTLVLYATNADYGASYAIRAVFLMVAAVVTACVTEILWCLATKKDILSTLKSSYPWVTGIILALMCQVNIDVYALIASTIIAIVFGKLVFGGFGQNIFNPAAVGRAVIFASFSGKVAADFVTGATPTSTIASNGWLVANNSINVILDQFGGLGNLFIGNYPGAMGETSALIILLVGAFLAWRKVIDWRVPVTYLATLFIITLLIGTLHGVGFWYPLYHLLTGGAMFGAVFMMTDPVTNPTSAPGRILFAIGCAVLTVIIRIKANLPEGVLYSILLMNMMTPMIEKLTDGNQIKMMKKNLVSIGIFFVAGVAIACACSLGMEAQEISGPSVQAQGNVYTIEAKGYQGTNVFEVEVENGAVVRVECVTFEDTLGIGDNATSEDYLNSFVGKTLNDEFDIVSGASYTSNSVIEAVQSALEAAGK